MSDRILICPQCLKEVSLPQEADYARCPACNRFLFRVPRAQGAPGGGALSTGLDMVKAVIIVLAIMLGLGAVAVGIAFIGCVAAVGRGAGN